MKRLTITSMMATIVLCAQGQTPSLTVEKYKYADEIQLWQQTHNAAGLSLDITANDSNANRGIAYFNYSHRGGDFHRVQEGGPNNQLSFFTERYQKIGKYLYGYGSFLFDMGRTKNRAWSDVIRTYNSNPFISGSSIPGKYDNMDFILNASLSTIQFGHFTFGGNLFYHAGDLSRLTDPRPRAQLAQYRITPAITYSIGHHTIGLAAHYDRRKEKIPGFSNAQTDASFVYYLMTGLENATGTINGDKGYKREYVNHEFGMELNYGLHTAGFHHLTSLTFENGTEYIYGNNKYQPGKYKNFKYGLNTYNRIQKGRVIHSADLRLKYETGAADEYRQEYMTTIDQETGISSSVWNTTMVYKKRYQLKKLDLDLHYRLSFTNDKAITAYAGIRYQLQSVNNKHLLNTSELKYATSQIMIEGGLPLFKRHLWAEAETGFGFSHQAKLNLADPTTDYALAVLIPDMAYYRANYWKGHLQLTYQIPITIKKHTYDWFARAYVDYVKSNHFGKRHQVGFSIGLYY